MTETNEQVRSHIHGAIEALLFVNEKPISLDQIKKVLKTVSNADIKQAIKDLTEEYQQRQCGINLREIAGGYQMFSNSQYASYIKEFFKTKSKEKLSKPALESLAIIAYKQPVTRGDVELVRGVNSDGVINHLLDKELIKIVGRKEVAGRPYLYGTTRLFLEYFGLKSLEDLPRLEEFPVLAEKVNNEYSDVDEDESDTEDSDKSTEKEAVDKKEINRIAQAIDEDKDTTPSEGHENNKESEPADEGEREEIEENVQSVGSSQHNESDKQI